MLTSLVCMSIDMLQEEARSLVSKGRIGRQQPIYTLAQHIPMREWEDVEITLEENGYLLRDRVIDLLPQEEWQND